jgi:hypothetical protein
MNGYYLRPLMWTLVMCGAVFLLVLVPRCGGPHTQPKEPDAIQFTPEQMARILGEPMIPDSAINGVWREPIGANYRYLYLSGGAYWTEFRSPASSTPYPKSERGTYGVKLDSLRFKGTKLLLNNQGAVIDSFPMSYSYQIRPCGDTLYYASSPSSGWKYFMRVR